MADGSTLEALFRKLKVLADVPLGQLAGKIGTVVDLLTRLPVEIWFRPRWWWPIFIDGGGELK